MSRVTLLFCLCSIALLPRFATADAAGATPTDAPVTIEKREDIRVVET